MTQHALGSDGKPLDTPSHKDSRKRNRESRHSAGYGCVHWTERELRGREEEEKKKIIEVIVSSTRKKWREGERRS